MYPPISTRLKHIYWKPTLYTAHRRNDKRVLQVAYLRGVRILFENYSIVCHNFFSQALGIEFICISFIIQNLDNTKHFYVHKLQAKWTAMDYVF